MLKWSLRKKRRKNKHQLKKLSLKKKKLTQKVPTPPKEFKIEVTKLAAPDNKPVDLAKPYIENKQKEEAKKE